MHKEVEVPSSSIVESSGGNGWVTEKFLKQRRYIPQITLSAESSNKRNATIQMTTFQEAGNDYVVADEEITLMCTLYGADGVETLVTAAHLDATTSGAEISTADKPRIFIKTNSSGVAVIEITDVSASAVTYHLVVEPMNVPGFPGYIAVTFAA
jgi:hypothetical protein